MTIRIQFAETFQFIQWERGRPADIQYLYDNACDEDLAVMPPGTILNMPEGVAWVKYRDGSPQCAALVTLGTVMTVSADHATRADRLSLVRCMKSLDSPPKGVWHGIIGSLLDWDELWVSRHTEFPRAGRLLEYFGFKQVDDRLYRRSAAK